MRMLFVGDIVLNDKSGCGNIFSEEASKIVNKQDYVIGNLEGPILGDCGGARKGNKRGAYIKNGSNVLTRLAVSGFNILTCANNHIMDYGRDGLENTLNCMKKIDIMNIGAGVSVDDIYRILTIHDADTRVAILSIGEKQFGACIDKEYGFAWMLHSSIKGLIEQARSTCDAVIICCHCGAEELDVPLPEVKDMYHAFIDAGATVIIGHHPHVIQGYEQYNDGLIFYSLGNFAFEYENLTVYNPIGLAVEIEIEKQKRINYETYITHYNQGKIYCGKDRQMINAAQERLESKRYLDIVNEFCLKRYNDELKTYYAAGLGLNIANEASIRGFVEHRMNGDDICWDELFIYHNIAIETNRWIYERACRMIYPDI